MTLGQGALGIVTSAIGRWVARRGGRSVTLELDGDRIELGGVSEDQDRRISVEELYDYVCEQVREITPDQSPNMLSPPGG